MKNGVLLIKREEISPHPQKKLNLGNSYQIQQEKFYQSLERKARSSLSVFDHKKSPKFRQFKIDSKSVRDEKKALPAQQAGRNRVVKIR